MRNSVQLYWFLLILLLPAFAGVTVLMSVHTRSLVTREIIDGFDRKLTEIITLTEVFLDHDTHRLLQPSKQWELRSEERNTDPSLSSEIELFPSDYSDPSYLRCVEELKRIRQVTGLSYLYSFRLLDQNHLYYVLDGSDADEFTPIGTLDTPPAGFFDEMKQAQRLRQPLVKPIEKWENWGLIKSGFTPIVLEDGRTDGFMGADLTVNVVKTREKQATLALIFSGVIGIVISFYAAVHTTRKLAFPILRLKEDVMMLASGNLNNTFRFLEIREYEQLAEAFRGIRKRLILLDDGNREIGMRLKREEVRASYHRFIHAQLIDTCHDAISGLTISRVGNECPLGYHSQPKLLRFWQFRRGALVENQKLSAKIALLAEAMRDAEFHRWKSALERGGYLNDVHLYQFEENSGMLHFYLHPEVVAVTGDEDQMESPSVVISPTFFSEPRQLFQVIHAPSDAEVLPFPNRAMLLQIRIRS